MFLTSIFLVVFEAESFQERIGERGDSEKIKNNTG